MKKVTVLCYVSGFVTATIPYQELSKMEADIKTAVLEDPSAITWDRLSVSDMEFLSETNDIVCGNDPDMAFEEARDQRHGFMTA